MSKLTRFTILLTSASLCAFLIGCQQKTDKKASDKSATEKKAEQPKNGASTGAKAESALEKTKEKAQEVGAAAKEKAQEVGAAAKEKARDITNGKDKSTDTSGKK